MNNSYLEESARELLELVKGDLISEEDLTEAIADISYRFPGTSEETERIMSEIAYAAHKSKSSRVSANVSLDEIKKKILKMPKPLAISLTALLTFAVPGEEAWAEEVSTTRTSQRVDSGMRVYIVQKGDSFEKIAKKMKVTVSELQKANPGADSWKLQIGQRLSVPRENQDIVFNSGKFGVYLVRSGDTLSGIAKKMGVPMSHLKELNGFSDEQADNLKVKQEIKTLDMDRLKRAFVYVETFDIPENKKDIATGDDDEALGCLQFHVDLFKEGAARMGMSVKTNSPGPGEWWIGDDRTNRKKCMTAFEGVCKRYAPISVEEMLKKANWNPKAKVSRYQEAYNGDLGKGIKLK